MNSTTIRIPAPLRSYTGGGAEITVEGDTVGAAMAALSDRHPELAEHIFDADGDLRRFVNLYLDGDDIGTRGGLDAPLHEGAVLQIVPAVAGGGAASRRRLAELRRSVPEVTPRQAHDDQQNGAVLIDVREPDEVAAGSPAGALRLVRGFLELKIENHVPDLDRPIDVVCGGGVRSLFAARGLQELGYTDVRSVAGGFSRWKEEELPVEVPRTLSSEERERYGRHLSIPEVGETGQLRLLDSSVLLVGAGGLGSPAALYLAAAGVGTLGVVDDDRVECSNLQRQILHRESGIGRPKVDSARETLLGLNPDIEVVAHDTRLVADNVDALFEGYDLILDGCDNFATRYLVNDACVKHGLPNVHGSIFRFEGQVSVFWPAAPGRSDDPGPCYRCLFPEPPPPELAPSCAEAGVLGVLPGVVGTLEAIETTKLLLGIGDPLIGRLLVYDALAQSFTEMRLERDPECPVCGADAEVDEYVEYETVCRVPA